jgi:hypothetical protein
MNGSHAQKWNILSFFYNKKIIFFETLGSSFGSSKFSAFVFFGFDAGTGLDNP